MGKCFEQVSDRERKLIKEMAKEGLLWTQIQRITGRSSETINTVLHGKTASPGSGAPVQFSAKDLDKVLKVTEAMVKKANAQQEVTMAMILAKAGITVSQKTIREGLKRVPRVPSHGLFFARFFARWLTYVVLASLA